jgi:phosphoserine phosphatase
MKRNFAAFFLFLLAFGALCASAHARKPRNPRLKKAKAKPAAQGPVKPAEPVDQKDRMPPGRWTPDVKAALEDLAYRQGSRYAGYDQQHPPVAILPSSDAAVLGDPAFALFSRLVDRVDFKIDDNFWQVVPPPFGRQKLKAYHAQFFSEPESIWSQLPAYRQYRKLFYESYAAMCRQVGRKDCRAWTAQLLWGFREEDLRAYALESIALEAGKTLGTESIAVDGRDGKPYAARRGLRAIPEIKDLAALLIKNGFDVWVVGDDPQWALEAAAKELGLDPSRAAGIRVNIDAGRLGSTVLDPVPFRGGKVDAVVSNLGRVPALVVGADAWDLELLGYGAGVRLVLDKGDAALRAVAVDRGWLIQPYFGEAPASPR